MSLAQDPFELPVNYARVKEVASFEALLATPFGQGINALCWARSLPGDFGEVARAVRSEEEITSLDAAQLRSLDLSPAGRVAVDILIEDQRRLRDAGLAPVLDCIRCYPRDEGEGVVPTDVYSFHADSAPVEADTYLCSYTESCSEGLRNEEALRCAEVPAIRARLLADFGGRDDATFVDYLREHCFDLHYVAAPDAQPFSFGLGNLWRIAVDYPGSPVPPCVHRAPATIPGRPPRLLLIS